MNQKGFTLVELLTVVLIIGVLSSIALPQYMRSIERSRATEAMVSLKALNDAVYAYAAGRSGENACPNSFSKLAISFPGKMSASKDTITSRDFVYTINKVSSATIPGTDCPGVLAQRMGGSTYDYILWNPYKKGTDGKGSSLACFSENTKAKAICDSLDILAEEAPSLN